MLKQKVLNGIPAKRRTGRRATSKEDESYNDLARRLLLESWPGIVKSLISKANAGSYQHTRLLLELCGMSKANKKHNSTTDARQLSDVLLEGLQIYMTQGTDSGSNPLPTEEKPALQDGHDNDTK